MKDRSSPTGGDQAAELVLPSTDLSADVAFFEALGFEIEVVFPADGPRCVVVSGHGLRLALERAEAPAATGARVRLRTGEPGTSTAPCGAVVEVVAPDAPSAEPETPPLRPALVHTRDEGDLRAGRAGMLYRDLIPGRQGGRFIASHVRVPDGGPVPDWVHFHRVRLQLIYVWRGWVRVVYEDQGPPFVLEAGDCVLQPPEIRHRVLECSPGLDVVELSCPAEHVTLADRECELPTAEVRPERVFTGQTFVRHVRADAEPIPLGACGGWSVRDLGIAPATQGLAVAHVRTATGTTDDALDAHDGELLFRFVLSGAARLVLADAPETALGVGDALTVPAGVSHALRAASSGAELLEVRVPAGDRAR